MPIPKDIKDNTLQRISNSLTDHEKIVLQEISCKSIKTLMDLQQNLLIFPNSIADTGDCKMRDKQIFEYNPQSNELSTGNVVGFIGKDGVDIRINSRFDSGSKQYFLHYMLQKVFDNNLLDLPTSTDDESIWDFLLYLFPFCLKNAMRKGVFRTYRTFYYNDYKVKGTIDIPSHIQQNIPYTGHIACQTREHTTNNSLIHLVRHTIETLHRNQFAEQLLLSDSETRKCVDVIMAETPDYNKNMLNKVILKNLRPIRHPFYSEYTLLQQLCLKILRHERITYGENKDQVYGILFDAAWLWEEYLAKILCPVGFKHPRSDRHEGAVDFYIGDEDGSYKGAIPDFYMDKFVIDAKYKPLEKRLNSSDLRDDRFQLISYMHILSAQYGILLFPYQSLNYQDYQPKWEGTLRGYGGKLGIYGLNIPLYDNCEKFDIFSKKMKSEEDCLTNKLAEYFS